jgi:leucyl-tRNA synthetase
MSEMSGFGPYQFRQIEEKWRRRWKEEGAYRLDLSDSTNKLYCLVMFSYPSADKLHIGHWYNFGPTDTWARFKRMQGCRVFEPMGFDSFGLPAENYAVRIGQHPQDSTMANIQYMRRQLDTIGAMYDWSKEVVTSDPRYYRWTQWLFLKLYEQGLAYKADAYVNWCPSCQTVLANEQAEGGVCERCDASVTKRKLRQWFFRITDYAQRLLDGLEDLDWPEKTKTMQRNWIGRSEGARIIFRVPREYITPVRGDCGHDDDHGYDLEVFTTRPDTLYGATYMVVAPEHPLLERLTMGPHAPRVEEYVARSLTVSEIERTSTEREKTGVFTGAHALHPLTGAEIPVWVADYVVMGYGTGAIMAVPAHDERDFAFAQQFGLPITRVICPPGQEASEPLAEAYTGPGVLVNSAGFDGLDSVQGGEAIAAQLERRSLGAPAVTYRLRDWLVSRQRYWGAPIPMLTCKACGEVAVPEEDLPVLLPYEVDFKPRGEPPLATNRQFMETTCPTCGGPAIREPETMDTFVCSSWYFLRYLSPDLDTAPWDQDLVKRWLPVDKYVGGAEHTVMHLMYARFVTMALYDAGLVPFEEPFTSLRHQGQILGSDGQRMSKSRGNTVQPEQYTEAHGSDVFRCHLMFGFRYNEGGPWDDKGVAALHRFLQRVWRLVGSTSWVFSDTAGSFSEPDSDAKRSLQVARHRSIRGVTRDTDQLSFNTALARIMEFVNELYHYAWEQPREHQDATFLRDCVTDLILLLAPFAPHLGEELWSRTGQEGSVFDQPWPSFDAAILEEDEVTYVIQINARIRDQLTVARDTPPEEVERLAVQHGRVPDLLEGRSVRKVIVVPGKLVNIVA